MSETPPTARDGAAALRAPPWAATSVDGASRQIDRWLDRAALPTLVAGALIAALLVACRLLLELGFGDLHAFLAGAGAAEPSRDPGVAVVTCLLLAHLLVSGRYVRDGFFGALAELRPYVGLSDDAFRDRLRSSIPVWRAHRVWGRAGAATGAAVVVLVEGGPGALLEAATWTHGFLWLLATVSAFLWLLAMAGSATLLNARFLHSLGDVAIGLDAFDRAPLAALLRYGLRLALVWVSGISIGSLLFLSPRFVEPMSIVCGLALAVGAAGAILPARGIQRRLQAAKQAELGRVREEILRARAQLLGRKADRAPAAPLADLVAWETRLDRVSAWRIEMPVLARLLLYLGIPLGSWIGGGLVQSAIERFLR